jgi:dTDP-4-dehydrorhamnose reductase
LKKLLLEANERYAAPIAVTEAHLGCASDEQMRWFMEIWEAARAARNEGADVLAVTVWSLLGSFDWHNLVTRCEGHYEPGVFDVSRGEPRPTPLARMVRSLASGEEFHHPALATPGWWRQPERERQCA